MKFFSLFILGSMVALTSSFLTVKVQKACTETFLDLKLAEKFRYITFKLTTDGKEIEVDETGDRSKTYGDFFKLITTTHSANCRFAVFAFPVGSNGDTRLVFITWYPTGAPGKERMIYASNKDKMKQALGPISVEVRATEKSEITEEVMKQKML